MEKTLFDFRNTAFQNDWRTINDGVMGGISGSSFRVDAQDSTAVFSGTVSLENNGGFASVRTLPRDFQLNGFSGMIIRVKGDGKTYSFRIRTDSNFDGITYSKQFDTEKDRWTEIRLPFAEFRPTFRGRVLRNVEPLQAEKIRQLGFLIADKQEGAFALRIAWIKAYQATEE